MSSIPPDELQYQEDNINQTLAPGLIAATSVFGFLALCTLCLRIYQRTRKGSEGLGLDDWLMVVAGIFAFPLVLSIYFSCKYGLGRHAVAITSDAELEKFLQWQVVLAFCYPISLTLAKLSVLALIARIFTTGPRYLKWGVWIIAIYSMLWCLATYLVIGLSCQPFDTYWSTTDPCNPGRTPTIYTGSFNVLGDVAVILLPQPLIWKLHMSLGKKLAVTALLAASLFATACGIVRMVLTYQLNEYDVTYGSADVALFFVLEVLVAISCGNLPTMHHTVTSAFTSTADRLTRSFQSGSRLLSSKSRSEGSSTVKSNSATSSVWRKFSSVGNYSQNRHVEGETRSHSGGESTRTSGCDSGVADAHKSGSEQDVSRNSLLP